MYSPENIPSPSHLQRKEMLQGGGSHWPKNLKESKTEEYPLTQGA